MVCLVAAAVSLNHIILYFVLTFTILSRLNIAFLSGKVVVIKEWTLLLILLGQPTPPTLIQSRAFFMIRIQNVMAQQHATISCQRCMKKLRTYPRHVVSFWLLLIIL